MQRRTFTLPVCLVLALMLASSMSFAQYNLRNLVSNQTGKAAHTDPLLINAWGLARSSTGPWWVSDAGSGWSTLYDGSGNKQTLQVVVPPASGSGSGSPTGIVFNGSNDFQIQGAPAVFLFATLDGTISGWVPSVNLNQALIAVDNSASGAVYTGLAVSGNTSGNFLFAADTANNKVDVYDANLNWVSSFTDTTLPPNFTPFGIQDIGGLLFVAFADVTGGSGGYIDMYSEGGVFLKRVAQGLPLNQPWGLAAAPNNFGPLSNTLLISNNTNLSGTINAYNTLTGQFVGVVKDTNNVPIHIDQLWGIYFGGGSSLNGRTNQLFFTAGPNNNANGTFGVISFK